jgi:hypothetical protein
VDILGYFEYPNITIAQGRVMHVVASDFQRIVYIRGLADAPEVISSFEALPGQPPAQPAATDTPPAEPTPAASPTAALAEPDRAVPGSSNDSMTSILLSSGAALLLLAVVAVVALGRRRA